jgi:hypothetical protein
MTKKTAKEFVKLIMNMEVDTFDKTKEMLLQNPELVNYIISGMAKGIDGFSSLQLSIRFFDFKFARVLIEAGADVNYMDDSPVRYYHYPLFFDLLEMLKHLVEIKDSVSIKEGMEVWACMEIHGLDYSKKSSKTQISNAQNCFEAFMRNSMVYANKHKLHFDKEKNTYELSELSRDLQKEEMYTSIFKRLLDKMDEESIKNIDANRYRFNHSVIRRANEDVEMIDYWGLEMANECIRKKYSFSIKNYDDKSLIDSFKSVARKVIN